MKHIVLDYFTRHDDGPDLDNVKMSLLLARTTTSCDQSTLQPDKITYINVCFRNLFPESLVSVSQSYFGITFFIISGWCVGLRQVSGGAIFCSRLHTERRCSEALSSFHICYPFFLF